MDAVRTFPTGRAANIINLLYQMFEEKYILKQFANKSVRIGRKILPRIPFRQKRCCPQSMSFVNLCTINSLPRIRETHSGCRMLSFTASFFPYFSANTAKSVTQTQPHPVTIHLPLDYERANRCQTSQKACRHVLLHPRAIIRRRACFVKWLAQSIRFSITVRSLLRRTFRLVGCLCMRDS